MLRYRNVFFTTVHSRMPKFRNSEPYYGKRYKRNGLGKNKISKPAGMNRPPLIPLGKREYRELMLKCQYKEKNQEVKEIEGKRTER